MERDPQLKGDAVGFWSGLAIALDSTAPAYSLAAVIGIVVLGVGVQAPAVFLLAFVPIFLTSTAYAAFNRVEPDCGTSFAWVRRSMGPWAGWVTGWTVTVTGILVIGSLAEVGAQYTYLLFGADGMAADKEWVVFGTVVVIVAMTTLTVVGTELSGRAQSVMVVVQVGALLLFAVWALAKGGAADPSLSWLNPLEVDSFTALSLGLLTAVFIYWGWESAISVNEETEPKDTAPGLAGLTATVVLLLTYVLVAYAVLAWGGAERTGGFEDDIGILGVYAGEVLPGSLDKLVLLAVATSGLASTQTTILPGSRTTLSMARWGAFPEAFARIHPRFRTPHVGTIVIAALGAGFYVPFKYVSENYLFDTITALGLLIAFYYAVTGFACAWFFRRRLRESWRTMLGLGVGPVVGATFLTYLFGQAVVEYSKPDASDLGAGVFGVGPPLIIGLGFLVLGVVGAFTWRATGHTSFFATRPELAPPAGQSVTPRTPA